MELYKLRTSDEIRDADPFTGRTFTQVFRLCDNPDYRDDMADALVFCCTTGDVIVMTHSQDCCEQVYLADIVGDLGDLVGTPILSYEKKVSSCEEADAPPPLVDADGSYTWTFYTFRTIKGSVDLRWFGTSNGYYSEDVDLYKARVEVTIVNQEDKGAPS